MLKWLSISISGIIILAGVVVLLQFGDAVDWITYLSAAAVYFFIEIQLLKNLEQKIFGRLMILSSIALDAVYTCNRVLFYPETSGYEIPIYAAIIVFFIILTLGCIKFNRQRLFIAVAAAFIFFFPVQRIPGSLLRQYAGYTRTAAELETIEVVYFSKISDNHVFAVILAKEDNLATAVFEKDNRQNYKLTKIAWMVGGDGSMSAQYPSETMWMIEMNRYFLKMLLS